MEGLARTSYFVLPGVGVPGCLLLCVLLLCGCNDMVSDEWLVAGG